ncbi:ABC transporter substrate-binding protein [Rhodoplanes sp. TEM]|uniref:ABC transporter substrate-binding protein n=1 Tax=Rhodoplanes tepidamans TaxID=200616 RepID=A0ABT5J8P5_RHOTP|nr:MULTISPECIES: ABC transporter substrate-binding protein [Rhodoplanes]MDC7785982.1 ABC transporter substrate-binding protein [Rhodoplanes tepidamans]MDC7988127.1 ABC transporter substrate-binding protein [Rhodoplanes sp. TEM]MDQ0357051.1 NitT/TauT family transport system substrate-binding protein [Rhodoplanes tepidamans]
MTIRGLLRRLPLLPVLAAAAVAAAVVLGGGATAAAQPFLKFTLDGRIDSDAAPFLLALDQGLLKAEGLDVSIDPAASPQEALARVAAGTYDLGVVDINALIKYRDQNPTAAMPAVFMIENRPPFAVLARRSRGIVDPKDLDGKRVGAATADGSAAYLQIFAKINGLDPARIRLETVALPVREPMLASGQVDAISASTLTAVDLEARGVPPGDIVVLPMADWGVVLYGQAIIASPRMLAERRDAVRGVLRAFVKALQETVRNPARAIDSVIKRIDPTHRERELARLRIAVAGSLLTPEVREIGFGAVDPARLARAIDQLALGYEFRVKPKAADVFDPALLPPIEDRLPR